jgi:TolB-like protein/Flp pilus assembly protein TadD
MSSIIDGYNYDIFISYRQKDNKGEKWVSEFVEALKTELESTFKEEISVYFDINPHDGLLETHDVDESLKEKLKCLIFIPIISRTYCDPKSFAWEHEFKAFVAQALDDQFGLKIQLHNGNVANRILPVRIHDLDDVDIKLWESIAGSFLRGVDFIYKEPGVNRPLRSNEENPHDNLNHTIYRNQVNKVAIAIKEIIYGLHPDEKKRITKSYTVNDKVRYSKDEPVSANSKLPLPKWLELRYIIPSALVLLLILAIFFIPKWMQKSGEKSSANTSKIKSVAVMPVLNFTGDSQLNWIADMIQSDLIGKLQGISNLIVRPRQTTLQFKDSKESIQQIAQKLTVGNLIESSIKGTEDKLEIQIRVIDAFPEEKYLYSSSFSQSFEELTSIYSEIINRILKSLEVKATDQEEKTLSVRPKANPEVRRACARGLYHLNLLTNEDVELGIKYYKEAITIDPGDPEPYIGLAVAYGSAGHGAGIIADALQLSQAYALKAIELDPDETYPNIGDAHIILAQKYFCYDYDFDKAIYHLNRGLQLNPNSPLVHYLNGWYFALISKIDEAASEMKKAIAIDPLNPQWIGNLAWMYQWTGYYEESLIYAESALKTNPRYPMALYVKGMVLSALGRHEEAIEIQKSIYKSGSGGYSSGLGVAYAFAGNKDKANEIAAELEKHKRRWITYGLAEIYAVLGNNDKAIFWLEEAYRQRHDFIPWIRVNPNFNSLHKDSRYEDIVNRLKLPSLSR